MKKKLSIVMMLLLVLTFVSCTPTQTEFYSKVKELNNWEFSDLTMNGAVEVILQDETGTESVPIDFTATGYTNNKAIQGYMDLAMTSNLEQVVLPQMKMFINKSDVYLNKDYFTQTYELSGIEVPQKLQALDAEYICISQDSNSALNELVANPDLIYSIYEQIINELGIDIPVTKAGNAYTITLDENTLFDQTVKAVDTAITNLDSLNESLALGLTQERINSIKSNYDKEMFEMETGLIKAMIKGSQFKVTYDFKDENTVLLNMDINIPITIPETETSPASKMTLKASVNAETKKGEPREVTLPEKSVKMTQQEYYNLLLPTQTN